MMHLFALEGIDGAGKTTVLPRLADRLRRPTPTNRKVLETGEFRSDIGRFLRERVSRFSAYEKVLLFAADRLSTLDSLRTECYDEELIVLWDRYVASAVACRGAEATVMERDKEAVLSYVHSVNDIFPQPTAYIYLEISEELSIARQSDVSDRRLLQATRNAYDDYCGSIDVPIIRVDGSKGPELVVDMCVTAIEALDILES
jgi:thymidylate kinase